MKKSNILFITFLAVFLSFVFAGCGAQGSPTISVKIDPTPTEEPTQAPTMPLISSPSIPTANAQPTQAPETPEQPPKSTLFLPNVYNNAFPNPSADATGSQNQAQTTVTGAQNQELTPENWQDLPVIPEISQHALDIYWAGIAQGNDPEHFSKVGDCQNIRQYFLGLFDDPSTYILGEKYGYLQETIDNYSGNWSRASEAVRTGFNVASVLTPLQANPQDCQPVETPLACEIRIWNPSFVLISMETWTSDRPVESYGDYLRQIVEYAISKNVLPIVATKADNLEGDHAINQIVANVAAEYDIPLWNFWAATHPLTDEGLREDRFHLTNGPNYYESAESLDLGWPVRNLTGLLMIDAVWRAVR